MICYASRTGTRRNLAEFRKHGWRLLVSATGAWRPEGFAYCLDNGAWTYHQQGLPFDFDRYRRCIEALGGGADWAVLPDVVGDPVETHELSAAWLPWVARWCPPFAALQDGATESQLDALDIHGLFMGGTTEFKEGQAKKWGDYARKRGLWFHVGRVNSARRISICAEAGAHSIDGTSGTKFAKNVAKLSRAAHQGSLFGGTDG